MGNAGFKLTYGYGVSVCCVGFAFLYVVCDCDEFMIVYVESFAHIECYSDCSRRAGGTWLNPFLLCYLVCVVLSL